MNIAIIDDSQEEKEQLKCVLAKYAAVNALDITTAGFSGGEEFLRDYQAFRYTLVFMDVYMDGLNGVETARRMREVDGNTLIVFLTTSREHMPDAFDCHAYDYIQKPFSEERIFKTLDDVFRLRTSLERRLTFTSNSKDFSIPFSEIIFVCSQGHYTEIQAKEGQNFTVRVNFSTILEALMQEKHFLLLIRGIVVNMDCIVCFKDGSCLMENGAQLQVNVRKKNQIEQTWKNYMFDKIRNQMNGVAEH